LTGFDAPKNTVLYLTRQLKDHSLLQAIARVNRLHEGKDNGYIIDYRGVLENLDHALDLYSTLPEFDAKDLEGILTDVSEPIATLPQKHSLLWDTFKEVRNKKDEEEYERKLADVALRERFYERLSNYSRTLAIALGSVKFFEDTTPKKIEHYRNDLKFFSKLRLSVRKRYAEVVDFSEYEAKIQKLLDTYVGSGQVEQITPIVNIFDKDAFKAELSKLTNVAAKADTIAHRTQKTIHEKMQEDPAFYKRFSELLEAAIKSYREERISANEYLRLAMQYMDAVLNRTGDEIPAKLKANEIAKAFFGTIKEILPKNDSTPMENDAAIADISLAIDQIIEKNRIVNWTINVDVQNRMRTEIEDWLFELKKRNGLEITFEEIDEILDECLEIAKNRKP
jgi:type I restriction enzyme, R subunit